MFGRIVKIFLFTPKPFKVTNEMQKKFKSYINLGLKPLIKMKLLLLKIKVIPLSA